MEKVCLEVYKERSERARLNIHLILKRKEWLKEAIQEREGEQDSLLDMGLDEEARALELGLETLIHASVVFDKELESELSALNDVLEHIFELA